MRSLSPPLTNEIYPSVAFGQDSSLVELQPRSPGSLKIGVGAKISLNFEDIARRRP